ncbi:MAG TPA: CHASE sensor domain-containing protein [Opitutaceae bacterium]|nr:CHASE sensor domain-containing protein [Opitutaceae bacterium]
MNAALRDLPIARKLTLIILLASSVGLLAAVATLVGYEYASYRRSLVRELSSVAAMTGFDSSAALTFSDDQAAAKTQEGLAAETQVDAACLYDADGRFFAGYRRDPAGPARWPDAGPAGERFGLAAVELFRPVAIDRESVGTIYLRADLREFWTRLGWDALIAVLALGAAGGISVAVGHRLQTLVSGPIVHLAGVAGRVAAERDYALRASKSGNDELGRLIDGFNEMLAQIQLQDAALQAARDNLEGRVAERTLQLQAEITERERLHRQLLDASRQAGMAEVATGVLHNVGNVLNSVNVSATLVTNQVRRSKAAHLDRLAAMLREKSGHLAEFLTADPKGRRIPEFLDHLAADLGRERTEIADELEQLRKNIEHIKQIVSMQQSYAKVCGVTEAVPASELVEDALRLNAGALARHGVEVVRDYGAPCTVTVERHKVLQILVNLIRNAKYACDESQSSRRELRLRIEAAGLGVRIAVIDNGVGIPAENLTRIFNHGFTTRKAGHGFGLHSGAIVAKELGGFLRAESAGPGLGAVFTLELPLHPTSS